MRAGSFTTAAGLACAFALAGPAAASPAGPDPLTGQVIVRYAAGASPAERSGARSAAGVDPVRRMVPADTQLVDPEPGRSVAEAVATLRSDPAVTHAEPDRLVALDAIPDDTLLPQQWGLINTGQAVNSIGGTPGADIRAGTAWDIGRSSADTPTAVIDSGITPQHPDFADRIWTNPGEVAGNGIDDDANGFVDDVHGWDFFDGDNDTTDGSRHGSHVAGIVGAAGDNGYGVTGVSWNANLMPVRVCGSIGGCSLSAIVNGMAYATRMGARVVNMSLGGTEFSPVQRDVIAAGTGTLFVVSAGNEGNDGPGLGNNETIPKYPCQADQRPGLPALDNVICVAATDQNDARSAFSNWGATSVDLAAPGSNIVGTVPHFTNPFVDTFDGGAFWDYQRVDLGESPTAAGWERVSGLGTTGGTDRAITDSFGSGYAPNSAATVTMTGSGADLSAREACGLTYFLNIDTQRPNPGNFVGADVLYVEAAADAGGPWTVIDRQAGNSSGYRSSSSLNSQATLDAFTHDPTVYVRFRLVANADGVVGAGATVDNVAIRCATPSPGLGHFATLQGTSMAAPVVAGMASIVRELNPGLSPAEVKAKILGGVDPVPAFSPTGPTPTVTGGRANLLNTLRSLDLTPPPVPELSGPRGTIGDPRPGFSWTVGEADATYTLEIDGAPVASGVGLSSYAPQADFDENAHEWRVTATDRPGNVSASESREFRFARPGTIKILSVKPAGGRKGGAKVRVRVSGAGTVEATAKPARGKRGKGVAKGAVKFRSAGVAALTMRPTRAGRAALRGRSRLKVKVRATFRPANGAAPASARRSGKLAAPKRAR